MKFKLNYSFTQGFFFSDVETFSQKKIIHMYEQKVKFFFNQLQIVSDVII